MIPDYESLMLPLLTLAGKSRNTAVPMREAVQLLAGQFGLTEDEKAAVLPSGGTFVISSRVGWAATYLKKAGLLVAPRRGHVQITDRGLQVLEAKPKAIDNEFLGQFAEFREFRTRPARDAARPSEVSPGAASGVPEEVIAAQYDLQRRALASQLLDAVKASSPQFFERLVVTLLVRMGYGGTLQDAGQAVGRSGDGGIDGVIKEDKLGLDKIYLQAKRWDDKPVGSPEIDRFAGALRRNKADKGVFLTTSTFTAEAVRSAMEHPSRIILIDGPTIAQLMIDHDVAVSVTITYQLKRLDSDFFDGGASDA
jgi:restriction system protein